jgi:hypothetical protein
VARTRLVAVGCLLLRGRCWRLPMGGVSVELLGSKLVRRLCPLPLLWSTRPHRLSSRRSRVVSVVSLLPHLRPIVPSPTVALSNPPHPSDPGFLYPKMPVDRPVHLDIQLVVHVFVRRQRSYTMW